MKKIHPSSTRAFGLLVITSLGLLAASPTACATNIRVGDDVLDAGAAGPSSLTSPDAGEADRVAPPALELCIATSCPAAYGTCGESYPCATKLMADPKNCGACGVECPSDFGNLNMTSSCVNGACEPACASRFYQEGFGHTGVRNFADCNKVLEDGCEVGISTDPNNCGACGFKCADGVRCIDGKCGCGPGQVDCQGVCLDVRSDDDNCGACGNVCQIPDDAGAPPPHMHFGCVDSQCGKPKCGEIFDPTWADCDHDLANGCEVYVGPFPEQLDRNNCGFCGVKCGPGQLCWDENGDNTPECGCTKPNETMCGSLADYSLSCHDLLNDPTSCGTCGNACTLPTLTGNLVSSCRKGVCELECAPGFGDCDLDPSNGCETNVDSSNAHCGACGNRCDTQAGQPCVEGKCVMAECDAGVPR